jgi:hypothetical protein
VLLGLLACAVLAVAGAAALGVPVQRVLEHGLRKLGALAAQQL